MRLPTIVVVPGGTGVLSSPKGGDCGQGLIELAKHFASDRFVACCYDGRGQGEAEGIRSGHHLAVEDLEVALAWLRENVDAVDGRRVGVFGQSLGGMAAVMVARGDDGIRSLVLWGVLPRYSVWKQKQERAGDGTFEKLWEKASKEPDWQDKTIEDFVRSFRVMHSLVPGTWE
ncbi:MAG: alpha/beta fold hydrolase [Acidobacteria bacterium]|nr:alpha/beta fold hydrolase [Acidobacteriota bacterium]